MTAAPSSQAKAKSDRAWLGVSFDKHRKKWKTRFHYNRRERFLGRFDTAEGAAAAYDQAVDIVQQVQAKSGNPRKRQKNFPGQTFNDEEIQQRVLQLIVDDIPGSDCDPDAASSGSPTACYTDSHAAATAAMAAAAAAAVAADDGGGRTAAAAAAPTLLLTSLLTPFQTAPAAGGEDSSNSSNGGSGMQPQQLLLAAQDLSAAWQLTQQQQQQQLYQQPPYCHTFGAGQAATALTTAAAPAAALLGSLQGALCDTAQPHQQGQGRGPPLRLDTATSLDQAGTAATTPAAAAAAGGGGEQQAWSSMGLGSLTHVEPLRVLLEPQHSSSLLQGPAGQAAAAHAAGWAQQQGADTGGGGSNAVGPNSTCAPGLRLWHSCAPGHPAAAPAQRGAVFKQQHSPFVPLARVSDLHLADSLRPMQQQQEKATAGTAAAGSTATGVGAGGEPDRLDDMELLLQSLLEGHGGTPHAAGPEQLQDTQQQLLQQQLGPQQQQERPLRSSSLSLSWDASGSTGSAGDGAARSSSWQSQHQGALLPRAGAPGAAGSSSAAAGGAGSGAAAATCSLQQEILRQRLLLQQVMPAAAGQRRSLSPHAATPGEPVPVAGPLLLGGVPAAAPAPSPMVPAGPASAGTGVGHPNSSWVLQGGAAAGSSVSSSGSWLAGVPRMSTALAFAAVCIQAIAEVKVQLKGLQPGVSLGQWLVQLRQELQAQAGLDAGAAAAAMLLMQDLALLLLDAGAFPATAGAAVAQVGRSFGLSVCESLQAALWLLHKQLVTAQAQPQGVSTVAQVVGRWVAELGLHVSSAADEAAMALIALV